MSPLHALISSDFFGSPIISSKIQDTELVKPKAMNKLVLCRFLYHMETRLQGNKGSRAAVRLMLV